MSPFIRNGDIVTVSPASDAHTGDIAAFTRPESDRLVIHRVIGTQGNSLFIKGDNLSTMDGLIPKSNILGRIVKIERNGKSLRLGLGPERRLIALLSRTGLLLMMLGVMRKIKTWKVERATC